MNIAERSRVPEYIYRYRPVNKHTITRELKAISGKSIYGSVFNRLNDPMEGIYVGTFNENLGNNMTDITRDVLYDKFKQRICAFSEEFNSDLMWAHYAGQSEGMCIRYDTKIIDTSVNDDKIDLVRIKYAKHPTAVGQHDNASIRNILSHKSLKWKNEKEWRIIFTAPDNILLDVACPLFIGKSISRVYFGTRINSKHKEKIVKCVEKFHGCESFRDMKIDGYEMLFPE